MHGNHPQGQPRGSAHNAPSRTAAPVVRQWRSNTDNRYRVDWTTWWLWRGARTRSHPELGRENPQRPWYCVLRHGRVGRRQVFQSIRYKARLAPQAAGQTYSPGPVRGPTSFPTAAGWSSPVARQAHNLKVRGSNPLPATKFSHNIRQIENASVR